MHGGTDRVDHSRAERWAQRRLGWLGGRIGEKKDVIGSKNLLDRWRRRSFRPNPEAARFTDMHPFVVVTGASRGIGLELTREFAEHGHPVLMIARNSSELEAAATSLRSQGGPEILTLPLDLTGPLSAQRIETALAGRGAYADILVNNAGLGLGGPFSMQTLDELQSLIDLNISVLTQLSRYFLPGMLARGAGGILNVGSMAGYAPGPQQAAYYASKAYVISLTEALAREVAGQGVRIAMVNPDLTALNPERGIPMRPPTRVPSIVKNLRLSLEIGLANFPSAVTLANRSSMFS